MLAAMARRLEAAGAEALAMPCNTAHHYARAIRAAATVPFLDMVELRSRRPPRAQDRAARVGILASPAVRLIGLFDAALRRAARRPLYPADEAPMLARDPRNQARAGATVEPLERPSRAQAGDARGEGREVQLVACSEFSIVADTLADEVGAIDTLDVLVAAIVRFATRAAETCRRVAAPRAPPGKPRLRTSSIQQGGTDMLRQIGTTLAAGAVAFALAGPAAAENRGHRPFRQPHADAGRRGREASSPKPPAGTSNGASSPPAPR